MSKTEVPVPVVIEPLPGHSDDEILEKLLKETTATGVTVLSPGFISAELTPSNFSVIEAIGAIHKKTPKQTRR